MRIWLTILALAICGTVPALANDNMPPKGPSEDGTGPALTKIAGEATMDSHAFEYLGELSDQIGARVTGSPAEHKAEEWGAAKMRTIGLENVHLEKYTIWKGWTRGTADIQMLTPVPHKLHADSMGWTGSTDPLAGLELHFPSLDAAMGYARRQALDFVVQGASGTASSHQNSAPAVLHKQAA